MAGFCAHTARQARQARPASRARRAVAKLPPLKMRSVVGLVMFSPPSCRADEAAMVDRARGKHAHRVCDKVRGDELGGHIAALRVHADVGATAVGARALRREADGALNKHCACSSRG